MTHYTNVKMRISEGQNDKFKKAFESNSKSITNRFKFSDLHGEDVIALTKSQVDRLVGAYEEKKGMTIRMSKMQLAHNMKIEGGFLPALAGLIPFLTGTVFRGWSFITTGEHGSTKTNWKWVVSKEGKWCVSDRNWWRRLYLGPASGKGFETVGNGLYLMKQGGLYDGRGLILGPNSPFKNIPILGMILWYYFQKKILYTLKMEIDETDVNDGHIYHL